MKKYLAKFTDEELVEEVKRRALIANTPVPLDNPDFKPLRKIIVQEINEAVEDQCLDDNLERRVYKVALEAVYGPYFWKWRNQQKW